jgi:putative hydrolases of HD superfamily
MTTTNAKSIADFIFELGSARRIKRSHIQFIGTSDDSISDHSFRVCWIALIIAKLEGADMGKVAQIAIIHDLPEIRTGDLNPVNKIYSKVDEHAAIRDQTEGLPIKHEVLGLFEEYVNRESIESVIVKDADLIEQISLEKEYIDRGVASLESWFDNQLKNIRLESSKTIAKELICGSSLYWQDALIKKTERNIL